VYKHYHLDKNLAKDAVIFLNQKTALRHTQKPPAFNYHIIIIS